MREAAHLSSRESVPSLRPLVAVAELAGRRSRNVRISCTFMLYHHKAPQHEQAQHATRIVGSERHGPKTHAARSAWRWSAAPRGSTDCSGTPLRRHGRGRRTHARPSPPCSPLTPRPLLTSRYYLDIINKIIVQHQIVQ